MGVARYSIYNPVGSIAPILVSIVTVPIYRHLVGTAEYGVLAIVWTFLGYFGVFGPKLSRVKAFSIAQTKNESFAARQNIFWTAVTINLSLGLLRGEVLYCLGTAVFGNLFKMPENLRASVMHSLHWLAIAVPIGTIGKFTWEAARDRFEDSLVSRGAR